MKDFISKLTFGFFMAQFVPGAIIIYSISFFYLALTGAVTLCLHDVLTPITIWLTSTTHIITFFAFSTAAGLIVHGLQWAVLGFLENYYAKKDGKGKVIEQGSIFDSFWHDKLIILQIVLGPLKIVAEVFMLFKAKGINRVAIEENVVFIGKDKMDAFNFLEEFYLHFAQFYAHVSYALVFMFWLLLILIAVSPIISFSLISIALLIIIWLASGCFFVMGRIQFCSLFSAEWNLRGK